MCQHLTERAFALAQAEGSRFINSKIQKIFEDPEIRLPPFANGFFPDLRGISLSSLLIAQSLL
jgi:hypothetical protein